VIDRNSEKRIAGLVQETFKKKKVKMKNSVKKFIL
jgi:hypothetical protein